MTIDQEESLTRELQGAMESKDTNRIICALANIELAMMSCQRKLRERVDRLGWRFAVVLSVLCTGGGYAAGNWEIIRQIFSFFN